MRFRRKTYERLLWRRESGNFTVEVSQPICVTYYGYWDPDEVDEGPVTVEITSRWRNVTADYDSLSERQRAWVDAIMTSTPESSHYDPRDAQYD